MRPTRPAPSFRSTEDGRNSKVWTVREGKLASRTIFNDSHAITQLMQKRTLWRRLGRRHCALAQEETSCAARPLRLARNSQGKRRSNKMHNLVVSCLAVAYLSANVYAIVKVRVFELAVRASISYSMASPSYCGALLSYWDASSWRSCADLMNGPPDQAFPIEENRLMLSLSARDHRRDDS